MLLLDLLEGLLSVLGTWLIAFLALAGVGLGARRYLGPRVVNSDAWLNSFWVGFGVVVLFLQIWHFFLPVTGIATGLVILAGCTGVFCSRREVAAWLSRLTWHREWAALCVLAILAMWFANEAMDAPVNWDSGTYHVPVVEWTKSYPVVPGLANLHGRLALNNSSLLFAALFDVGPWTHESSHFVNGLLLFVLASQVVVGVRRLKGGGIRAGRSSAFFAVVAAPVCLLALSDLSSLVTDLTVAMTTLAAAGIAYVFLVEDMDGDEQTFKLFAAVTLLATAATIKISVSVFSILTVAVALAVWFVRRHGAGVPFAKRAVAVIAFVLIGLAVTWLLRGVILSGYPVYPGTVAAFPVAWRVPDEQARAARAWISHSARTFAAGKPATSVYDGTRLPERGWFGAWLRGLWFQGDTSRAALAPWEIVLPTALALLGVFVFLLVRIRLARGPPVATAGWLLCGPALAAIVFWFVTAPNPRFGFFLFWVLAATCLGQAWAAIKVSKWVAVGRSLAIWALLLGTAPVVTVVVSDLIASNGDVLGSVRRNFLVKPGPLHGVSPLPHVTTSIYLTDLDLALHVPDSEDQRCWAAPLPCTPHPARNLRLRDPDDLGAGFVTDGTWRQERWPTPWNAWFLELWRRDRTSAVGPSPP